MNARDVITMNTNISADCTMDTMPNPNTLLARLMACVLELKRVRNYEQYLEAELTGLMDAYDDLHANPYQGVQAIAYEQAQEDAKTLQKVGAG